MPTLTKAPSRRVLKRALWEDTARDNQLTPPGDWRIWLLLAGRGFGKTRTAAEDVAFYGQMYPKSRIAVMAETFGDGRDVCMEGESGLLSCLPEEAVKLWNRSIGELFLHNGTNYKIFSGDKPDGTRGYQFHRAWLDELAKYRYPREAWTQLSLGMRLGENPQTIVTTTPKPISLLRDILKRVDTTVVTTGSTFDNAEHLSDAFLDEVRQRYEGTRVGRQELYAEILDDTPGAIFQRDMIRYRAVAR